MLDKWQQLETLIAEFVPDPRADVVVSHAYFGAIVTVPRWHEWKFRWNWNGVKGWQLWKERRIFQKCYRPLEQYIPPAPPTDACPACFGDGTVSHSGYTGDTQRFNVNALAACPVCQPRMTPPDPHDRAAVSAWLKNKPRVLVISTDSELETSQHIAEGQA